MSTDILHPFVSAGDTKKKKRTAMHVEILLRSRQNMEKQRNSILIRQFKSAEVSAISSGT